MGLLKWLIKPDVQNVPLMNLIEDRNNENMYMFNNRFMTTHDHKICKQVLSEIALKRLFECYTYEEIVEILKFFQQVK